MGGVARKRFFEKKKKKKWDIKWIREFEFSVLKLKCNSTYTYTDDIKRKELLLIVLSADSMLTEFENDPQ